MKRIAAITACAALSVIFPRFAIANEHPQAGSAAGPEASASADELHFVTVLTMRGQVVAVDQERRRVTLKDSNGGTRSLEVRSDKALESLKAGDRVVLRYFEGARIGKRKSVGAVPVASLNKGIFGSELGGASNKKHVLMASLEAVDAMDQEVTLKGPDGSIETIMVVNPEELSHVKAGDHVVITQVQALAVSVEKEG